MSALPIVEKPATNPPHLERDAEFARTEGTQPRAPNMKSTRTG